MMWKGCNHSGRRGVDERGWNRLKTGEAVEEEWRDTMFSPQLLPNQARLQTKHCMEIRPDSALTPTIPQNYTLK